MEKQYPIMQNGNRVGVATIEQQGMFWLIQCQCAVPIQAPLRITVQTDADRIDLGICVGQRDGCGLSTRIPVRSIPMEEAIFLLEEATDDFFYPVAENKPFSAIDKLNGGRFAVMGGQQGIVLPDYRLMSSAMGQ